MRLSLPFALPDRRRVISFVLALAVEAALIFLLLVFGPQFIPMAKKPERRSNSFSLTPSTDEAMTSPDRHTAKATVRASSGAAARSPRPPTPPIPVPATNPSSPLSGLAGVLPIELGAKDISKLKSSAPPEKSDEPDQQDSKLAYGPGLAPGGQSYYMGDWYRLPTVAEMAPYLPKRRPAKGWGLILCKTAARYHVDDCRMVAEYPAGSGLGRAALDMSWQFLIRPPRLGGKTLVGTWVGVRVDYSTIGISAKANPAEVDDDQPDSAR
jgi:protein TonB